MSRSARLYALLARSSSAAVVFRRGPSKQVLLLGWDRSNDEFEEGQWLKGRIYERRCDLSPDGQLLLYFAASYRAPYFSWSAVSRPPYLTALALWPKGDAWGGGGHFESNTRIALNHRASDMTPAEGFVLPRHIDVHPFGGQSGWGEDHPVWSSPLERDGWTMVSGGRAVRRNAAQAWITFDPPVVWEKRHPLAPEQFVLRMEIHGLKESNGPWYVTDYAVLRDGTVTHAIGRSDWADWDTSGDLLFSKQASLYRLGYAQRELAPIIEARPLIDLGALAFTPREAPESMRRWPVPRTRAKR
jgi:hypothetical protein